VNPRLVPPGETLALLVADRGHVESLAVTLLHNEHKFGAAKFQHPVESLDGNPDFGVSPGFRARSKSIADHPLVSASAKARWV
jgi:hypothetical protein